MLEKHFHRVAIADDCPDEVAAVVNALIAAQIAVTVFRSGKDLIAALRRDSFDAVLLDWMMPGMDGLDVLAWIRGSAFDAPPVIMLTSKTDREAVLLAFEAGASDYISKPEDPDLAVARVKAAVRDRAGFGRPGPVCYGDYCFDPADNKVTFRGHAVKLRPKEFALAQLLFENLDRPLSRMHLQQAIWRNTECLATRTLDVHVSRLRACLELKPESGLALRTIFGHGYRLERTACPPPSAPLRTTLLKR
jgi:DNA-binding response OmpR family regulator